MSNLQQAAQEVKSALDKITAAKSNPQQLDQAINDAKSKVDQLTQQASQGQGGQQR
jgi:phage shock protein A